MRIYCLERIRGRIYCVLSSDNVLDNAVENEYIFDIDCLHTINELDGREVRMEIFFYLKVILFF